MRTHRLLVAAVLLTLPVLALADPQDQAAPVQFPPASQNSSPPASDVFSYSYLQVNRLSEHSDFFGDRSAGNGLQFSYGFDSGVYLFGQWNRLDFEKLDGSHDLAGIGVGAHQAYSQSTSFFLDLEYLRDQLSGSLGGARDYYWRVSYGFHSHLNSFLSLTGAIFTERNTDFGRRPFGERLGLGFGGSPVALDVYGEHTADGNRLGAALTWYYK